MIGWIKKYDRPIAIGFVLLGLVYLAYENGLEWSAYFIAAMALFFLSFRLLLMLAELLVEPSSFRKWSTSFYAVGALAASVGFYVLGYAEMLAMIWLLSFFGALAILLSSRASKRKDAE